MKLRLLAFLTSFFSASIGVGGGCFFIPGILSLSRLSFHQAASISLCLIAVTTGIASSIHLFTGNFIFQQYNIIVFVVGCIAGSIVAGPFINKVTGRGLKIFFAVFCLFASVKMFGLSSGINSLFHLLDLFYPNYDLLRIIPFSLLVGATVTLLGVGCGLVIVPFLVIFLNYEIHSAISFSLSSMFLLTATATLVHQRAKNSCKMTLKKMIPMSILGSVFGCVCSGHLPAEVLKKIFASFLLYTAIRYFFECTIEFRGSCVFIGSSRNDKN